MSDPEDAPVDLVKASANRRPRDRLRRVAEPEELLGRDDPVLTFGKCGNCMVSSWFVSHIETKGEVTVGSPPLGEKTLGNRARCGNLRGTSVRVRRILLSGRF